MHDSDSMQLPAAASDGQSAMAWGVLPSSIQPLSRREGAVPTDQSAALTRSCR